MHQFMYMIVSKFNDKNLTSEISGIVLCTYTFMLIELIKLPGP